MFDYSFPQWVRLFLVVLFLAKLNLWLVFETIYSFANYIFHRLLGAIVCFRFVDYFQ